MEIDVILDTSMVQDTDKQTPKLDLETVSSRYRLDNTEKRPKSTKHKTRGDWSHNSSLKRSLRSPQQNDSEATFREKSNNDTKVNSPSLEHPLVKSFKKYRLEKLVTIFAEKLKRSVVLQKPFFLEESNEQQWTFLERIFGETDGIDMNNFWIIVMQAAGLIVSTWLVLIYSLVMVFRYVASTHVFKATQSIALTYFLAEVLLNFFVKVYHQGKIISEIRHIIVHYLSKNFLLDFAYFILIIVDVSNIAEQTMTYLRMIVILRFTASLSMIDKLETMVCTTFRRQQQWGLVLLFLVNFMFAHVLSICLNSMAYVSEENWWVKHGLLDDEWYVRYIYGYYWGINIMLTVGFGDLSATNWKEALCLIFIELISCILFTYNINCVGNLFNNLRLQSKEKEKNVKTFRRMCSQSHKSVEKTGDLQSRINYFIEKSFQIKNTYDLKGQEQTMGILPEKLKNQFKKRVNTKLLQNLNFFKQVNRKSLEEIALHITKKITIPEQIIIKRGDQSKLMLLYPGEAAYIAYEQKRGKHQAMVIQRIPARKQPRLLSFKEFVRQHAQKYDIMATQYSVLYTLEHESFRNILRVHRADYEKFCQLRDSSSIQADEGYECKLCPKFLKEHSRFQCPRQHYFPLREIVCLKYEATCKYQNRQSCKRLRQKFTNICEDTELFLAKSLQNFSIDTERFGGSGGSMEVYRSAANLEEDKPYYEVDKMYSWRNYYPSENISNKLRKMNKL